MRLYNYQAKFVWIVHNSWVAIIVNVRRTFRWVNAGVRMEIVTFFCVKNFEFSDLMVSLSNFLPDKKHLNLNREKPDHKKDINLSKRLRRMAKTFDYAQYEVYSSILEHLSSSHQSVEQNSIVSNHPLMRVCQHRDSRRLLSTSLRDIEHSWANFEMVPKSTNKYPTYKSCFVRRENC